MHVLALCDYYDELSVGGAEVVAREVYGRLVRDHEVDVTVVGALAGQASRRLSFAAGGHLRHVSVPGTDLSGVLGAQLMISRSLYRVAREEARRQRPDVIHVNGLHFHSSMVGIRLAGELEIPSVATAHLADVVAMPGPARLAAVAFDRLWAGRAARRSHRVVAVSRSVAAHMAELGVDPQRIDLAYNGVDHNRFRPLSLPVPPPRPSTEVHAVIVGRLMANKGTLLALEAVSQVRASGRAIRLTVVGDGPLESKARRRASQPDLAGSVEFTGRVADVERWLAQADVTLRPSYTEGLPLAVIESLACGTPVICAAVPGTLEVITDDGNGIVVPVGDAGAMAAALVRIHDDPVALGRMARAAVESAAAFSWSESAASHLGSFELATAGSTAKAGAGR